MLKSRLAISTTERHARSRPVYETGHQPILHQVTRSSGIKLCSRDDPGPSVQSIQYIRAKVWSVDSLRRTVGIINRGSVFSMPCKPDLIHSCDVHEDGKVREGTGDDVPNVAWCRPWLDGGAGGKEFKL